METFQVSEKFSNGNCNELAIFETEQEARDFFAEQLKEDGYKPGDHLSSWVLEIDKIILDDDGDIGDIETIIGQTMYEEGFMDRNRVGSDPIDYWFEAVWKADKQELEYTFYYNGKVKGEPVLESDLKDWYYRYSIGGF